MNFQPVLPDISTIRQGRTVAKLTPAPHVFKTRRAKAMWPRLKTRPGQVTR